MTSQISLSLFVLASIAVGMPYASAQTVKADRTVGTRVNRSGSAFSITEGTVRRVGKQGTLFHSFEAFSPAQSQVDFDLRNSSNQIDTRGINRVISRVTGKQASFIDGTLSLTQDAGATGADLFLINPQGIQFGANAQLQVPGSFFVSTADAIVFGEDSIFSAVTPEAAPLLSVSAPLGLQMGSNPAAIALNQSQLALQPGKKLSAIGGDINLQGASISTQNGIIELGAVGADADITWDRNTGEANYSNIQDFSNITLDAGSALRTSGDGGGQFQLQGKDISIRGGSLLEASNSGASDADFASISASDAIEISGSRITVDTFGSGRGNQLRIATPDLQLTDSAALIANSFGVGDSGGMSITADQFMMYNNDLTLPTFPTLFSQALGAGSAGDISIQTGTLDLSQRSFIVSFTMGEGKAGNIDITATRQFSVNNDTVVTDLFSQAAWIISASGIGATGDSGDVTVTTPKLKMEGYSQIASTASSSGNSGDLTINADSIQLRSSAQIGTVTRGSGKAGDININATESVNIQGNDVSELIESPLFIDAPTGFFSSSQFSGDGGDAGDITINTSNLSVTGYSMITSFTGNPGKGGNITLNTDTFRLSDNAQVSAESFDAGDAGDVRITATDSIELQGFDKSTLDRELPLGLSRPAAIVSNTRFGSGNAGDITIKAEKLNMNRWSQIGAYTEASGKAGNINLEVGTLDIANTVNPDSITGIQAGVNPGGTEDGGAITIEADRIRLRKGGQISTDTAGSGNAGVLMIRADQIDVDGISEQNGIASKITSNSQTEGDAGSVKINAKRVQVRNGGELSVSSTAGGSAGNLKLNTDVLALDQGNINAEVSAGDQGNIEITADRRLLLGNRSLITTNATQEATGGNITLRSPVIVGWNNSDIQANAVFGSGGNIAIESQGIFGLKFREAPTSGSDITASSQFGLQGTVSLNGFSEQDNYGLTVLPDEVADQSQEVAKSCSAASRQNRFTVTQSTLPTTPSLSTPLWYDARAADAEMAPIASSQAMTYPQEATGWTRNQAGEKVLVNPQAIAAHSTDCLAASQ